jgi:hypothetical protein
VLRAQGVTTPGGLAGQEDFQALMAEKPAGTGYMEYVDLKAVLSLLYDTGVPLLQTVAKPNVLEDVPFPIDWALLPPASRVVPHFRSMASYMTWNEDGLVLDVRAPVPVLPIAIMAGAVGYLAMGGYADMPDEEWVMEVPMPVPGDEAEMDAQLAAIQGEMLVDAVSFYRLENGRLPASLRDVVDAGLMGELPEDPWGGAYRLRSVGDRAFVVESAGPDRAFDTADDVVRRSDR